MNHETTDDESGNDPLYSGTASSRHETNSGTTSAHNFIVSHYVFPYLVVGLRLFDIHILPFFY